MKNQQTLLSLCLTGADDGISGQKLDRDDFQRLLQDVRDGKVEHIVFTKLDRWFRSLRHYLNTQAVLEKHHVSWTAIDQPYFDTSTPYGRAFVAQSMTWAELEAQNGGQRVRDVFKTKVQHGEAISGKVPRGYRIEGKRLVLSEEAPAIYDAISYFLKTQSIGQAVRYLEETHGIVMTMQNFRGSYLCNEKLTGRFRGMDGYCPRLISDEVFEEIQGILQRHCNVKTGQRYPYLFSGLLICEECGHRMAGCHINVVSRRAGAKTYRYRYPAYECRQHRSYHRCPNGGEIREATIERFLLDHIGEEIDQYVADYHVSGQAVIDNRDRKNKIRKKLGRLKDLYLNGLIPLGEYKADRAGLEMQLGEIPDQVTPRKSLPELKGILGGDFGHLYQQFTNEEKRVFWRSILHEIRVSRSVSRHRDYKVIPF